MHSFAPAQLWPFAFLETQWFEPSHQLPLEQPASLVQVPGQLVPEPLHRYGAQLGLPVEPAGLGVHVPKLPDTLHASQAAPQAVLQQYPSMQLPLVHSTALAQLWPFAFLATHWFSASQ